MCTLADSPNWMCGSKAYDCVFGCRDEDSVLEAVIEASSLNLDRKREVEVTDTEVGCCIFCFYLEESNTIKGYRALTANAY